MSGDFSDAAGAFDGQSAYRWGPRAPGYDSVSVAASARRWGDTGRDRRSVRSGFNASEGHTEDISDNAELPRGEMDVQLEIAIRYKGNMSLKIATELIINQPTTNFMTLPMTLTLTSLSFSGARSKRCFLAGLI